MLFWWVPSAQSSEPARMPVCRPMISICRCTTRLLSWTRSAGVPADLVQLNKRVVHRQMEIMGLHTGIRAGSELCALGTHQKSMHEFLKATREKGLTGALQQRDEPFGDYRTRE